MRYTYVLLGLLFCGCAATQRAATRYDAATGITTFTSPKLLVGNVERSSGLTNSQRVMMQAFASCGGLGCTPSQVYIVFFNDSSMDLNIDYRRVEILYSGRSLNWEDVSRIDEPAGYETPRGEFVRVPLSRSDFERMSNAATVEILFGLTGVSTFRVPHSRRTSFREFADTLNGSEPGA